MVRMCAPLGSRLPLHASGAGKALLQYGIEQYSVHDLAVNEQNPLAKGFYEHMGFTVYKRTERDEQGNPYPLLYMKRGVERRNFP